MEKSASPKILSPGVWRSADGGKNWELVNRGLAGAANFTRMKWHPTEKNVLFLGTYGSGFYRLTDPDVHR